MSINAAFESVHTKACIPESGANIVKHHFQLGMQLFFDNNFFHNIDIFIAFFLILK